MYKESDEKEKVIRTNLSVYPTVLEIADNYAAENFMTRSAFITFLIKDYHKKHSKKQQKNKNNEKSVSRESVEKSGF